MQHPFRKDGLAFMRAHCEDAGEEADEIALAAEEAVWEKCTREKVVQLLEFRYRSEIRETVYGQRSRAQSPRPPTSVETSRTASKTIPKCTSCGKNDRVTWELVQRRSADEGMTPEYSCDRCNVFWH